MTKKILAALLSVVMVVSMLPTTIFATNESVCPVLDEHEGYNDHSKAHCDAHGVTYTQISKVEAECGQDGYTLYQCECGAYFADDIIPMDPHHTESGEPKTERVEPTCYSKGTAAIFVCDECGKDYFDPTDPDADEKGEIAMLPHTFDDISYPGNDCTAAEQVCQNEGCTAKNEDFEPCDEHHWVYDDPEFFEVVLAPTYHADGIIKFYCDNDGCAQYKEVVIKALEPHTAGMTLVEAVEPDCDSTGNIEYWKDEVCGKLYIETNEGLVEVTEEEVFLDVAHDWNQDPTIIAPTCTEWGFSYYGCPTCGATKGVTEETEDDEITKYPPLGHTPYACPDHEEVDDECEECTSYGHNHTAPTCLVDGEYTWFCGRCDEEQPIKDPKTNHTQVTLEVPGTHLYGYSYTIVYCTNEHCDLTAVDVVKKTIGNVEVDLDVTVEVREDGNVYDMPAGSAIHVIAIEDAKAVTTNLKHFYKEDKEVQAPNCTDDGKAFWYCAGEDGCNTYYEEILPATGHNYDDTENDIAATCTTNAKLVCDNENCGYQKEVPNTKGHKWATEKAYTTLPTCTGDKGYDWYECTVDNCTAMDKRNPKTFTKNKTYLGREDLELTSKEEFELEHPGFATALDAGEADYEEYREGDCLNNGYWKATCPDCDKTYLVLIDDTGKGHKAPDGTTYYEEATCTDAQGYVDYNCVLCGELIENENDPLGHDMTKTEAKAPNCLEEGNEEYWTCSRDCCKVNIAAAGEEEELVPIPFKDEDGEEPWDWENDEHIIPATGHTMSVTTVTATCTTDGFVHHICTNEGCDVEYVDGYVAPLTHTKGDKEYLAPNCTTPGYENYLCGRDDCDGYYSEKTLDPTGHKNAAGQTIVDKCTDTVTDRVCVNTNCPLTANAQGKKVVAKSHNIVTETVNSSCEHYGYVMETCANGCGEKDKVTDIVDPHGHWAPWGEYIMADDMTAIDEDYCGYYGEEFLYWDEEFYGEYNGYITAYTAPTYESLGSISFICPFDDCGDEITRDVIRTGVDFIMEGENASKPGAYEDCAPSDGDVISFEITLNAYQTDVWGFNFDVFYNAASMNFLGYTYNAGDVFANYKVNNITDDALIYEFDVEGYDVNGNSINDLYGTVEDVFGTIKVSAYTENDIDGKIQDALVNGTQSVITLYFQVEAKFDYTFMGVSGSEYDYDVWVDMYGDYNGNYSWPTVVNSEGEVDCNGDGLGGYVGALLDINYSDDVTITDLYFCNMILTGEAEVDYLASADANKDGQITITDLDLMNQLLQGADESVIYGSLAWTAPEGFVAA